MSLIDAVTADHLEEACARLAPGAPLVTFQQAREYVALRRVKALLVEGVDVNQADNSGQTALLGASFRGYTEIVEMLLNAGANVNQAPNGRLTALIKASSNGHTAVVALLLAAEPPANVNQVNRWGDTALMGASFDGHVAIVRMLLAAGANVNQSDWRGETALMWASRMGRAATVKILLAAGADVNHASRSREEDEDDANATDGTTALYRWTALMEASEYGHADVVELLLAAGANVNLADSEGDTALSIASERVDDAAVATVALIEDAKGIRARHLLGRWRAWFRRWRITNYWWRVAGEGQHAPGAPGHAAALAQYDAEYA